MSSREMEKAEHQGVDRRGATTVANGGARVVTPRADAYEGDAGYLLVLDVPGSTREHVSVVVEEGTLRVRAPREGDSVVYQREYALPSSADPGAIHAKLNAGVLRVEIPKSANAKPRRVEVQAA